MDNEEHEDARYEAGYEDGHTAGVEEMGSDVEEAREDGYDDGYADGESEGEGRGYDDAMSELTPQLAVSQLDDNGFTVNDILDELDSDDIALYVKGK